MSTPNKTPTAGGSTPAATRTPAAGGSAPAAAASNVQTIDIRVPKNINKKLAIMRFNGSMGIDFVQWKDPKMERENNQVQFKGFNEEMPKFGAGSEYGREAREEARRKKYGIISKKYNPENQPWILQHGGKSGKKFRGVRDGGINENASYYVFTQAPDGVFDAFPVQEQYSFQAVQNYKPLSIEEAEEGYNMRNKTYNMFNVMMRKRLRKTDEDAEEDGEEEGEGKGKSKKKKGAKDSRFGDELDDMMASSDDDSSDGNDDNEDDDGESKKKKKKGKKPVKPKKKRKNASDDEALEDSDDGDGEGRELDYISSSDDEESDFEKEEAKDGLKGVAEEDALRKLLNSDEEDEDEEKEEEEDKAKEEEDAEGAEDQQGDKASKDEKGDKKKKKDKKKNKDKKPRNEDYGSSSDSGAESSASELEKAKPSPKMKPGSANSSRSATPTKPETSPPKTTLSDSKRKGTPTVSDALTGQATKKPRLDMASTASAASPASAASLSSTNEGVNEESVRRYLSRKPMTTTELLQKFKSKRTGLSSEQLVPHIAQILKKINPVKQTIKGKMYLSIKA